MSPKKVGVKDRMVTSIRIDSKLWKQAKIEAIKRNVDVSDLVENAVRKDIGFRREVNTSE